MIRIRIVLIALFCWIALMLAAGRIIELPLLGTVSPSFTMYLIAALTMGTLIVYPELADKSVQSTLFVVLGGFGAIKVAEHVGDVIAPSFIAMTALEVVMLTVTVFVTRRVSSTMAHAEKSIHNALLPWYPYTVLNEQDGEKMITEELLRARRYERPLTIIRISAPRLRKKTFTRWSHRKLLEYEYVNLRIIQVIRNLIYDSDIIAWHKNDLVVCLPETKPEEARVLAFPLESMLRTSLPDGAKVSMAHFPTDALVYKDLLAAAQAAPPIQEPVPVTIDEGAPQPESVPFPERERAHTRPQVSDPLDTAELWPVRQSAS